MVHRLSVEALDHNLFEILRVKNNGYNVLPFDGKVFIFREDFRQILHVIPNGSRQDMVHTYINSAKL